MGQTVNLLVFTFGGSNPSSPTLIFYAEVAQLVEHNLAKVGVASSSLVFRSICSVRITVSTQDSQSCNRGSIPLPSTKFFKTLGV